MENNRLECVTLNDKLRPEANWAIRVATRVNRLGEWAPKLWSDGLQIKSRGHWAIVMKWRTGDDDDNDDLEKKAKRSSGHAVGAPNKKYNI